MEEGALGASYGPIAAATTMHIYHRVGSGIITLREDASTQSPAALATPPSATTHKRGLESTFSSSHFPRPKLCMNPLFSSRLPWQTCKKNHWTIKPLVIITLNNLRRELGRVCLGRTNKVNGEKGTEDGKKMVDLFTLRESEDEQTPYQDESQILSSLRSVIKLCVVLSVEVLPEGWNAYTSCDFSSYAPAKQERTDRLTELLSKMYIYYIHT